MSSPNHKIPKWREDFPVESEGDDHVTRRDFLRFLTLVSAGLAAGNGYVLAKSFAHGEQDFEPKEICKVSDLEPGSWRVFKYPDDHTDSVLVRRTNGEFIAFNQACPHLACPIVYEKGDEEKGEHFSCHCHDGEFSIATGEGTKGPPRELRPLRQVKLQVEGGRVIAAGMETRGKA